MAICRNTDQVISLKVVVHPFPQETDDNGK
jgi:hypothetical protein